MKSLMFSFLSLFAFLFPISNCLAHEAQASYHEIEVGDYLIPIPNHYQVRETKPNNFQCTSAKNENREFFISIYEGSGSFDVNDYATAYRNLMYENERTLKTIRRTTEQLKDNDQYIDIAIQLWGPSQGEMNSIVMVVLTSNNSCHGVAFLSDVPLDKATQWHDFIIEHIYTQIRKKPVS